MIDFSSCPNSGNMSLNNANDTEKYIKSLTPERKALLDRGFDMINEKYGKTLDALAGNDVDFDDLDDLGQMSKSE